MVVPIFDKANMQDKLHANELDSAWLASFDGIKVLSLDCFDTLLWRKVVNPSDVFFALAHSAAFKKAGLTATLRAKGETAARRMNWIGTRCSEVNLEQIYRQAAPLESDAVIAELAAAELDCEIDYCFAFQPVCELIAQARERGLKVVIVSDTYLSEAQLRTLLFTAMPSLAGLVDAVYCSNEFNLSKRDGIWRELLPLLEVKPEEILHLGDNLEADVHSPRRFGIRATHFIQQHEDIGKILKGRAQVAVQVLPELGYRAPIPNYYHAQLAVGRQSDALATFGYACLGPILYGFADFVLREAAALRAVGRPVKVGFLLRDGFLPSKACAELAGAPIGSELNISRFTAIAASLDSRARVVELLSKTLSREAFEPLTRQLMLPPARARDVLAEVARSAQPEKDFARLVLEDETLAGILAASRAFRRRLVSHVRKVAGVESGDTLMLVDLGYSGTAQTLLEKVLKDDLNVDLAGCYLLADQVVAHHPNRKGLIDSTRMDARITYTLTGTYIAAFEMLCTQSAPSIVDYTEQGVPVFSATELAAEQRNSVHAIQAACLRFIAERKATPACHQPRRDGLQLAQCAVIDLARLLYFPTETELACLKSFQFDFNLGTDMKMALFDPEAGLRAMRTHGFGYMNAGLEEERAGYAMELRSIDMSLSAMLFSQNRFGFDIQPSAASYRKEKLQVLVTNRDEHTVREVEASATYDGYFSVSVPLSSRFNVGILFGNNYTWLQIDSVQRITDGDLLHGVDMAPGDEVLFDQMDHADNGLFQVADGGLAYLPGLPGYGAGLMCRVIFRPVAWKPQQQ